MSSESNSPNSLTANPEPESKMLKKHWYSAASECRFPEDRLAALCDALNNRGESNKSRLEFVLSRGNDFGDAHARATTLTRLLLEYHTRRSRSQVAQDKWMRARRAVLALKDELPVELREAPIFARLEAAKLARPQRRLEPREQDC